MKSVTMFEAFDGRTFRSERECEAHEAAVTISKIVDKLITTSEVKREAYEVIKLLHLHTRFVVTERPPSAEPL